MVNICVTTMARRSATGLYSFRIRSGLRISYFLPCVRTEIYAWQRSGKPILNVHKMFLPVFVLRIPTTEINFASFGTNRWIRVPGYGYKNL